MPRTRIEIQKDVTDYRYSLEDQKLKINNPIWANNRHELIKKHNELALQLSVYERELAQAKARGERGRTPSEIRKEISDLQSKQDTFRSIAEKRNDMLAALNVQLLQCNINALQSELMEAVEEEKIYKEQEHKEEQRKEQERKEQERKEQERKEQKRKEEEAARKRDEEEKIRKMAIEKAEEEAKAKKMEEEVAIFKKMEDNVKTNMKFDPDLLRVFVKELEMFNKACDEADKELSANISKQENNTKALSDGLHKKLRDTVESSVSSKWVALRRYESELQKLNGEEIKQERDRLWNEYQAECAKILQGRKAELENCKKKLSAESARLITDHEKSKTDLGKNAIQRIDIFTRKFTQVFNPEKISKKYAKIYTDEPFDHYKNQSITPQSIRIASLTYDLSTLNLGSHAKALLEEHYPALYRHGKLNIPYCIDITKTNGIYFLQNRGNRDTIYKTIQSFILKLLLQIKPGLIKLTLYDGEGSGKNLIGLSHIDKRIKGENILTDPNELKRALEAAISGMNTTIQKVLGSKHADKTLMEYNETADVDTKPYHIIVITDFPKGLSKEHLEMINKIVRAGKQAGVFIVMGWDTEYTPKNSYDSIDMSPLLKEMKDVKAEFTDKNQNLFLNTYFPETDELEEIQKYISDELKKIKVNVNLDKHLGEENFWQSESISGIETPIGKMGMEIQNFTISIDTPQHCLIGGATNTGKTVLLHNIICNTAWNYSPDEVQFVLLDYKEGTEFKLYENLPHAKVLSIHSEREYGISVLEYISEEIERRGKLFKSVNAQNIAKYRENTGEKMPRLLVIIDEFQKLLDGDMKTTSFASAAFDDIGRRGRSFGIHLILSSQSLLGVDINRTLSHLGLRICLKLTTERDCDYFLGQSNYAPFKDLQREKIGAAIYNASGGLPADNVRFQVAYLSDEEISKKISALQKSDKKYESFVKFPVYDGNVSASFENNKNIPAEYAVNDDSCEIYIGEPVALKEKHSYYFLSRDNESNVLIVGHDILAAISILSHSIKQIVPQSSEKKQIYVCNKVSKTNEHYKKLNTLPDEKNNVKFLENDSEIQKVIESVFEEVQKRLDNSSNKSRIILAFADIYNMRLLRKGDYNADSPLAKKLVSILKDGPGLGIHCIIHASSFENLKNVLDVNSMLNEFNVRIELRGGDGYKIFQSNEVGVDKATPNNYNIANLQTSQTNGIRKIKVYGF